MMSSVLKVKWSRSTGVTLVETSIALAVAAVVVSVCYSAAKGSFRRNETQASADFIVEVLTAARASYGQTGMFSQLNTQRAVQSGLIPRQYLQTSQASATPDMPTNSYGGAIILEGLGDTSSPNGYGYLSFESVPEDQCMPLVMAISDVVEGIHVTAPADTAKPDPQGVWNVKPRGVRQAIDIDVLKLKCTENPSSNLHFSFNRG